MQRYKYRAINEKGRSVRGVMAAGNEIDLHKQLQNVGLELVQAAPLNQDKGPLSNLSFQRKPKLREIIQLFIQMEQMQTAGVALLDALADIRDTTDNGYFRDVMSEIYRDVSEGSSLSQAMGQHPQVFSSLFISLISAGEETGDMQAAYRQLIKYLKWVDEMNAKVKKATRYPIIVTLVVIVAMAVMMGIVVPQVVGFIESELKQDIPFYTVALIATSDFFVNYWWGILGAPIVLFVLYKVLKAFSDDMAYRFDLWFLNAPVFGDLIRKINIARFTQTFGSLYASGLPVLEGLKTSNQTVGNIALRDSLKFVHEQVKTGSPLSEALNNSGEFPSLVVRMVKVGEESGNMSGTLEEVSTYYSTEVDEKVQGMITMIEPALTGILGGMIAWIAISVFGPIYGSFEDIGNF